jgi:hypothetical protein
VLIFFSLAECRYTDCRGALTRTDAYSIELDIQKGKTNFSAKTSVFFSKLEQNQLNAKDDLEDATFTNDEWTYQPIGKEDTAADNSVACVIKLFTVVISSKLERLSLSIAFP